MLSGRSEVHVDIRVVVADAAGRLMMMHSEGPRGLSGGRSCGAKCTRKTLTASGMCTVANRRWYALEVVAASAEEGTVGQSAP
ncbi:hypothetical protein IG631_01610 [Alternaria alternata]|nr:hypothetical protein IG631_01610 [Alternaria alternata]